MGVKGKLTDLPGCKTFYFRVRTPKNYTFDIAYFNASRLDDAYESVKKMYPGAVVSALQETEFAADGLPVLKPTIRKRKTQPAPDAQANRCTSR